MGIINHNIEVFVAVAETLSVTAAARRLYISQPAVSKAIRKLEEELGTKLFKRSKRTGLALTSTGEETLRLSYALMRTENDIYQTAFRDNNLVGGKVTVASLPITTTMWLAPALSRFNSLYPHVKVSIREGGVTEIEEWVKEQAADFGLVDYVSQELEHRTLLRDQFCGVVAPGSPIDAVSLVDEQDSLILNRMSRDFLIPLLPAGSGHFETSLVVEEPDSVITLALHGNGVGIVAPFVIAASLRVVKAFPVDPVVRMDYGIVASSFETLSPAAAEFARVVAEVAEEQIADGAIPRL